MRKSQGELAEWDRAKHRTPTQIGRNLSLFVIKVRMLGEARKKILSKRNKINE